MSRRIATAGLACLAALAAAPRAGALTARASSAENPSFSATMAIDGNPGTRWSSEFSDFQWLELDFGKRTTVAGLSLRWENAFARAYTVLVSDDAMNWTPVHQTTSGNGGLDEVFFAPRACRFVRIACEKRGTSFGYSLWEVVPKTADEGIRLAASSSFGPHPATDMLDGNPVSYWTSDTDDTNAWIEVNLPPGLAIAGLRLIGCPCPASAVSVATSTDGTGWTSAPVSAQAEGAGVLVLPLTVSGPARVRAGFAGCRGRVAEIEMVSLKEKLDMNGMDRARSIVGPEAGDCVTFVGKDGSFAPEPQPAQIGWCVQDGDRLLLPATSVTTWELLDGRYPVSIAGWDIPDGRITTTVFAEAGRDGKRLVTLARAEIENRGAVEKRVLLHLLIQPCPLADKWGTKLERMEFDGEHTIRANGHALLWLSKPPATNAASAALEMALGAKRLQPAKTIAIDPDVRGGYVTYDVTIPPAGSVSFDGVAVAGSSPFIGDEIRALRFDDELKVVRAFWQQRVPMELELPDREYADAFYSSLYYLLIMQKGDALFPGPYNYKSFFLHDAVEMNSALDCAGVHDTAGKITAKFDYKEGGGYVDELGGSIYGLFEHYRFTRDADYLARVYPRMIAGCRLIQKLRANPDTDDDACQGLLPKGVSQDNFKYPAHLYVDNWWALIGLKSAMAAAERLGETNDTPWLSKEYRSLHDSILHSIRAAMKREATDYMPGFADHWAPDMHVVDGDHRILGDTQMAWAHRSALFPGRSLGIEVPFEMFHDSYAKYWKSAGRFSGYDGGWFVEYEKLFWGYNVQLAIPMMYLGMGDVTLANIAWSLRHQTCPGGWSEAMTTRETASGRWETTDEAIIGDVPHGWTAAYYILLLRNMLMREAGETLELLPCVPESWLAPGRRIAVRNATTYFGPFGFEVANDATGHATTITLTAGSPPPRGYTFHVPRAWSVSKVEVDGKPVEGVEGQAVLSFPPAARVVRIDH